MTKSGAIEFDHCILDALRDDRLVFVGAWVSMRPPSNLASFWKPICNIAQGIANLKRGIGTFKTAERRTSGIAI